jgi:hypothetical protein
MFLNFRVANPEHDFPISGNPKSLKPQPPDIPKLKIHFFLHNRETG